MVSDPPNDFRRRGVRAVALRRWSCMPGVRFPQIVAIFRRILWVGYTKKMWHQTMTFSGYVGVYKIIQVYRYVEQTMVSRSEHDLHSWWVFHITSFKNWWSPKPCAGGLTPIFSSLPRIISVSSSKQIWIEKKVLRKHGLRKWCPTHKQSGLDSDFWASNP